MNSRNYTYIRTLLNGSYCTDAILNRVFCLSKQEVIDRGINDWCKLTDTEGREIADWIKATDRRVNNEKRLARYRTWIKDRYGIVRHENLAYQEDQI